MKIQFCQNTHCESEAREQARTSTLGPHDGTMYLCGGCYNAYMIGVQHGRFHEAAERGDKPGGSDSQEAFNIEESI